MMRTRIFIGAFLLLGVALLFWLDRLWGNLAGATFRGYFICLAAMVATGIGLYELFAMARKVEVHPFTVTGVAFGVVLLPYYIWSDQALPGIHDPQVFIAFLLAPVPALVLILMAEAVRSPDGLGPQLQSIAVTFFGVLYVALPMTFLVRLRFLDDGWNLVVLVIAVSKASDCGAYFTGSLIGRRKLAPLLSPNKTVEGALGGLLAGALVAILLVHLMHIDALARLGHAPTLIFGLITAAASQIGDLTESLIKRSTGAKDSGALVPAFGGVLDIIDSFLVSAPVAYFLLALFARIKT